MLSLKTRTKNNDYRWFGPDISLEYIREYGVGSLDPVGYNSNLDLNIILHIKNTSWECCICWFPSARKDYNSTPIRYLLAGSGSLGDSDAELFFRLIYFLNTDQKKAKEFGEALDSVFTEDVLNDTPSQDSIRKSISDILEKKLLDENTTAGVQIPEFSTLKTGNDSNALRNGCRLLCEINTGEDILLVFRTGDFERFEKVQEKKPVGILCIRGSIYENGKEAAHDKEYFWEEKQQDAPQKKTSVKKIPVAIVLLLCLSFLIVCVTIGFWVNISELSNKSLQIKYQNISNLESELQTLNGELQTLSPSLGKLLFKSENYVVAEKQKLEDLITSVLKDNAAKKEEIESLREQLAEKEQVIAAQKEELRKLQAADKNTVSSKAQTAAPVAAAEKKTSEAVSAVTENTGVPEAKASGGTGIAVVICILLILTAGVIVYRLSKKKKVGSDTIDI